MSIKEILDFIFKHKIWFILGLLIILCILVIIDIIIAKKNDKKPLNLIDTIIRYAFSIIPSLINSVEVPSNGSYKKNLVLNSLKLDLYHKYGFKDFDKLESLFSNYIEEVLHTPQATKYKKEV